MERHSTISVTLTQEQILFFRNFLWESLPEVTEKSLDDNKPEEKARMELKAFYTILRAFEEPVVNQLRETAREIRDVGILDTSGF